MLSLFTNLARLPRPDTRSSGFVIGPKYRLMLELRCPPPSALHQAKVPLPTASSESPITAFSKQYSWEDDAVIVNLDLTLKQGRVDREDYATFHAEVQEIVRNSQWVVRYEKEAFTPSSSLSVDQLTFVAHDWPTLAIELPAWEVASELTQPGDGEVVLRSPEGRDTIVLGWQVNEPWTAEDLQGMEEILAEMMGGEVTDRGETTVAGGDAAWFYHEWPNGHALWTFWSCTDQLQMQLATMGTCSREELTELHERILATVVCHEIEIELVVPEFDAPPGCERLADGTSVMWICPDGSAYMFLSGSAGRGPHEGLQQRPGALATILRGVGFIDVRIESGPEMHGDRAVWIISEADSPMTRVRTVVVSWYCPEVEMSFLALHSGAEDQSVEEVLAPLLEARCPGPASSG